MSEPGSSSDEGSSSFSSKSESAMSESSGSLLESCTRETLDDLPNRQTLAIASSSSMALGEGVVFDAIPIVRSEFTADHLKNNLLNNEKQVEALRQSCNIPRSVGIRLVHDEEWPSEASPGSCYVLHPDITDFRGETTFTSVVAKDVIFDRICTWATQSWFLGYFDWILYHLDGVWVV